MSQDDTAQQATLRARLQEMENERERLVGELEQMHGRIRAVRILIEDRGLLASLILDSGAGAASANGDYADMGVREAIRAALERAHLPLKPRQVTDSLQKGGFRLDGRSKMTVRVSQEMHRMLKSGQLHRTANGRYRVKA